MVANVIREHPWNPNLLFLGTEFGLFLSINGGKDWVNISGDLPRVPIDDIVVNEETNDLILGTHGRGFIILDDLAFLESLDESVLDSKAYLFPVKEAFQYFETRQLPNPGASQFSGPNPEYGAMITYYLKNNPPQPAQAKPEGESIDTKAQYKSPYAGVKIIISDARGNIIREIEGPDRMGFNRVHWDLRYPLSYNPEGTSAGYFEPKKGVFVLPDEYEVKLLARGLEFIEVIKVRVDPRVNTNLYWLRQRFEISMAVSDMQRAFSEGRDAVRKMSAELKRIEDTLKGREDIPDKVKEKMAEIANELEDVEKAFKKDWRGLEFGIMDLAGKVQATTAPPTQAQRTIARRLKEKLDSHIRRINELVTREFPDLQVELVSKGVSLFIAKPIRLPRRY
jgi:hypothetical protein